MGMNEDQKRRMEANRCAALARRNCKLQCPVAVESSTSVHLPLQQLPLSPHLDVNAKNRDVPMDSRPHHHQGNPSFNEKIESHKLSDLSGSVNDLSDLHVVKYSGGPSVPNALDNLQHLNGCGISGQSGAKMKVALEICAPDRFFLMVKSSSVDQGFLESISSVVSCENVEPSAKWPVYNLKDYDKVTETLKGLPNVEYEQIPWSTRMVLEKFQKAAESGVLCLPNHITDSEVEQLLLNLPPNLSKTLLPFQKEGVKFGLQRGGLCLFADEMGVGKTIQAIAMASCYKDEGSLLVICPASLRLVWADELERWLPYLSPLDVHLVFGRKDNLTENMELPKVVVISFNMLTRLRESMLSRKWGMVIVDEAHNIRCTSRKVECDETMAVLELVQYVKRVVLLTGTPSLSRPFDIFNQINCLWPNLLGKNKYEFARNYCDRQWSPCGQGNFKDYSRGSRLTELNVLLKQTVMIRRLKEDIMMQLPPKRRQLICLQLAPSDVKAAKAFTAANARERISVQLGEEACKCGFTRKGFCDCEDENEDESHDDCEEGENPLASKISARSLTEQEIGVAKLRGFQEWLLNNSIFAGRESQDEATREKMIIFAHHLKVLDIIQTFVQSKGVEYVRIDGSTLPQDRLKNVNRFRSQPEVKLAIIGVQAGGVGLDFSAAQSVVFVELPKSASEMLQAEDRAHRRGQKSSVNIYIFVAKGTADDRHWQSLSRSLERVSTMTNGAETTLEIDCVVDMEDTCRQTRMLPSDGDNRSVGVDINDQFSEESCITSEFTNVEAQASVNELCKSLTSADSLTREHELQSSTPGFKDMTDELGFDACVEFPATSLMFEVSSNTGRVHLFLRSSDEHSRPTSLQANFKPEDLAHFAENGICERGALPAWLIFSAAHREAATLFLDEYNRLRPVFRNRLRGRPLSLPLEAELKSYKDKDHYVAGGIMKGGSKRRWTPKEEVGAKIPAGAMWRTVSFHRRNGLKETKIEQAWSAEDVPLCKYCQNPCKGKRSVQPELFEDLFCQTTCLNEYSNKTSRRRIREELFDLEGGVCVKCGLDCHALVERIRPLPVELRQAYIVEKASQFTKHKRMLQKLVKEPIEGNAWHADHIIAVADGGGECTLENFQTLCIACHAEVTADQRRHRAAESLKTKLGLQKTMKKLKERSERVKRMRPSYTDLSLDSSDSDNDQDLLDINVAGSAYSTSRVGGIAEMPTACASKAQLHPPDTEGEELCNTSSSSPQPQGITEVNKENILLPASVKGHLIPDDLMISPNVGSITTEVLVEHSSKSTLKSLSIKGHVPTDKVKKSPYFPSLEDHKPSKNARRLSQVVNLQPSACCKTGTSNERGTLAPATNGTPDFSVIKKPTFSLRDLNKYLL